MQINFAYQALEHLGMSHFKRTWPMDSIKEIWPELEQTSEKAIDCMVKRARIDLSPSSFPALKRILELVKEEQQKINLASSPAEPQSRREIDKQFASRFGQKASEHEKLGMAICLKIASGELQGEKLIEALGHMEAKFPGVGWKEEQVYWIQELRNDEDRNPGRD